MIIPCGINYNIPINHPSYSGVYQDEAKNEIPTKRSGKMMMLNDINDNILISHPSYWGLYQYEAKMRSLQRDKYVLGWEPNQKI